MNDQDFGNVGRSTTVLVILAVVCFGLSIAMWVLSITHPSVLFVAIGVLLIAVTFVVSVRAVYAYANDRVRLELKFP